jgi:2',3'-cyclic-nucleotide 2'-phosphodiesterase (5'-nucleotidase family)
VKDGEWTGAAVALQGPGGMRAGLTPGTVIYADLVTTTPFENILVLVDISGAGIREALEFSVSDTDNLHVMQVSGIKVTYDLSREPYDRIKDVKILCQACDIPKYEPLDDAKDYKVVIANYIYDGGDSYTMFPKYAKNPVEGARDVDALADYIEKMSPMNLPPTVNRITFV